ncbi:MAG: peptide chain release factor 2 [Defluviitaleaceae bacterium]|nr:peptide chain release factor 2 [Defluviitaleaceae bacterium]
MLVLDELQQSLSVYNKKLEEMGASLDVAGARAKVSQLEEQTAAPEFWSADNQEDSQKLLQRIKQLKNKIEKFEKLKSKYEDAVTLCQLGNEENDAEVAKEAQDTAGSFLEEYETLRIATLLNGEYDRNNAIITLHSGAGGTESCDWVSMLFRMYLKWAERSGYTTEVLDMLDGEEAGIKSVTFQINGENAFGYMRSEKGVHRLVRISPFDGSGRRHTSFASCDVMPELDDSVDIEINPDDLKVDTYRSSGAGGQHVNKTESAIRITHVPSGIGVACQNERSQFKNRDVAMKMLRAKLYELRQEEQMNKLSGIRGEVRDIAWGSQIRSYVFHPYSMAKDHRTGAESGNIQAVMDGNIDMFMNEYLIWKSKGGNVVENAAE